MKWLIFSNIHKKALESNLYWEVTLERYLFSRNDYGILTLITSEELLADDKKTKTPQFISCFCFTFFTIWSEKKTMIIKFLPGFVSKTIILKNHKSNIQAMLLLNNSRWGIFKRMLRCNIYNLFTPRFSWNTSKVALNTKQPINQ
jgi:hypothetical protein